MCPPAACRKLRAIDLLLQDPEAERNAELRSPKWRAARTCPGFDRRMLVFVVFLAGLRSAIPRRKGLAALWMSVMEESQLRLVEQEARTIEPRASEVVVRHSL